MPESPRDGGADINSAIETCPPVTRGGFRTPPYAMSASITPVKGRTRWKESRRSSRKTIATPTIRRVARQSHSVRPRRDHTHAPAIRTTFSGLISKPPLRNGVSLPRPHGARLRSASNHVTHGRRSRGQFPPLSRSTDPLFGRPPLRVGSCRGGDRMSPKPTDRRSRPHRRNRALCIGDARRSERRTMGEGVSRRKERGSVESSRHEDRQDRQDVGTTKTCPAPLRKWKGPDRARPAPAVMSSGGVQKNTLVERIRLHQGE